MKKVLLAGLIVGFVLGIGQIFLVRTTLTKSGYKVNLPQPGQVQCEALAPECGYCPGLLEGDNCYTEGAYTRHRGFPLTAQSGGSADSKKLGFALYANMAFYLVLVPLLFVLVAKLLGAARRKSANRTEPAVKTDEND